MIEEALKVDTDTRDYRATMVEWAAATHKEVREIRLIVQFFFAVWLLGVIAAIVAVAVGAGSDWFSG